MNDWAISCKGLTKRYGPVEVLSGVDFDVENQSVTAILGASGSGKTTLLRIVMGFVRADSGALAIAGKQVSNDHTFVAPEKRAIGYVAQEGALFPHLTVSENIGFGLKRSERKSSPRIAELLELVGLSSEFANRHPHQLSGGEQRRVALARSLAPKPQVILLDEPFTGLDAALRAETRTAVVDALTNEGTAAVIVTHDPAEAFALGKQVAVLRGGRLVQTADPITVYQMPIDLETARFVGDCVVLPGEAGGEFVTCSLGRLPLQWHANGKVQVMLRPEQIQVSLQSSAQQAIVVATTYFGKQTMVELSQQNEGGSKLLASLASQTVPAIGTKVGISVAGKVVAYPLNQ